jgi:amidase
VRYLARRIRRDDPCGPHAYADISVIGPLARGAEDLDLALDAMAGPDEIDGAAWKLDLPACSAKSLRDLRVAVKLTDPNSDVDAEYLDKLQALVDALAKRGARVKEIEPKLDTGRLHEVYVLLLRAATSARTPEVDVVRWRQAAIEMGAAKEPYLDRTVRGNTLSHRDWLLDPSRVISTPLSPDLATKSYPRRTCVTTC